MSSSNRPPDDIAAPGHIPVSTYRLQFNRQFTFAHATELAEYLRDLGISDVYASPLFQAAPESTHGYDTCSFEQLNPNLGTAADAQAFGARLRELGLGLLVDIVPNHMGADLSNRWWADVLEHGPTSPYAPYFDIDWHPPHSHLRDKVLLPVLEDHYAKVLGAGKLQLAFAEGAFVITYYERKFPVAPHCYLRILEDGISRPPAQDAHATGEIDELRALASELRPGDSSLAPGPRGSARLKERLWKAHQGSPGFRALVQQICDAHNGQPGKPESFDRLHALLAEQFYRLAYWRVGPEEINYRRFFDVTQLVSLRMELPEVFAACHRLVFELLRRGVLTGLRVDHPDGLWNPKEYFIRLQAAFANLTTQGSPSPTAIDNVQGTPETLLPITPGSGISAGVLVPSSHLRARLAGKMPALPGLPQGELRELRDSPWPLYIVAEKILTGDEGLPQDWPVAGTTGYDFLSKVNGLFVNSANGDRFDQLYREFSGFDASFKDSAYLSKRRILECALTSELDALTHQLKQLSVQTREGLDFSLRQAGRALAEIIASFPVYRTYLTSESTEAAPIERRYIEQAIAQAKTRNPDLDVALLAFIQELLLLRPPRDFTEEARKAQRTFIARFQQLTGPVTAKGVEDTAFYNYNRLVSLNEVGGDPAQFGTSVPAFHRFNLVKAQFWPHTLLATATHDTKRGEDTRARINVLSEMPEDWQSALDRWARWNVDKKTLLAGAQPAPDPNDESLLYQTLIGAWPFQDPKAEAILEATPAFSHSASTQCIQFRERVVAYMTKALRESKAHSTWSDPNQPYEKATTLFIERILDPNLSGRFLTDLRQFQQKTSYFGAINSIAQVALKSTAPGVPDFYQGAELWDLSLVDPDNRRPVDYGVRRKLLTDIQNWLTRRSGPSPELVQHLLESEPSGQIKLYVTNRALAVRKANRQLFAQGAYVPLNVLGAQAQHVCAFARVLQDQVVLTIAPRLVFGLMRGAEAMPLGKNVWSDTALHLEGLGGSYYNVFTGATIAAHFTPAGAAQLLLSDVLNIFPVAILTRTRPA